jgi:hypothetical protein
VAKDYLHPVVKAALIQEGWTVTHDPLELKVGGVDMEIDLGAERIIGAERQGQRIAVEVKSFLAGGSAISEFHRALGQFINYRIALRTEEPDRILYLAVPFLAFNTFFQLDFPKSVIDENKIKLLVYDTLAASDLLWIPEITPK